MKGAGYPATAMLTHAGPGRQRLLWILLGGVSLAIAAALWWARRPSPDSELTPIAGLTALHREVDCGSIERSRLLVLLVLGQSNAANHGQTRAGPAAGVFGFHEGRCFEAADPLPGASGDGGSVWTRLAPQLLQPGQVDAVLLVPLAVNSTSIEQWNRHPVLLGGLQRLLGQLNNSGFRVSKVLWHQGEAESFKDTSGEAYREGFTRWLERLRGLGVDAPVWVARATRCQTRGNAAVSAVQAELPGQLAGVRAGPELDRLFDTHHRYDGCHFSSAGLTAAAQAWRAAIAD